MCGDSKYGTAEIDEYLHKNQILPSIPRWNRLPPMKCLDQWGKDKFIYNKKRDVYICPNKKELKRSTFYTHSKRWIYRSSTTYCDKCKFREKCLGEKTRCKNLTRHIYNDAIDKALEHIKTEKALETIKERKVYPEWAFAEAKSFHGLEKAKHRGLSKVNIQALLIASVQNIKRLLKHYENKLIFDSITQIKLAINTFVKKFCLFTKICPIN